MTQLILSDRAARICLAVVDGTSFELPGHRRLSFVADRAAIAEGVRRLAAAVAALTRDSVDSDASQTFATEAA